MNWKYEAMDKLKLYEAKKQSLQSIPKEIAQVRLMRRGIRSASSDSTPVQGGGSRREDMLLSSVVKEQELEWSLELAQKWVSSVEAGLAILTDEERLVLDRFYIHSGKGNVERLCEELHLEKSQVYSRKDAALRRFTIALYGDVEN